MPEEKCAKCGFSKSEHSYNGACYGVCGEFVSLVVSPTLETMCCYTGVKPVFMCDDCPARNDFVGKVKPHAYVPSTMHMGDCAICGHVQTSQLHREG